MANGKLEHVNVNVSDPKKTAELLCRLFDWNIRWQGPSMKGGLSVHVGTENTYLALYSSGTSVESQTSGQETIGGLNHIGIVVDDFNATRARVKQAGFKIQAQDDYDPGQRFYFQDHDAIEFEVVSYEK